MFKLNLFCTLLSLSVTTWSQTLPVSDLRKVDNSEPQKVTIKGAHTELEASRDFAAGKLIIGRKKIADSGLQNAGEILKREPAITVGKDGQIGLLGLPGYTQILLNGQSPVGRSPLEMDLSDIERIEIIKTSTARTGPFGIAGSINVITKKVERKRFQQASAGVQDTAGVYGANAAWSINEVSMDSPWQWRLSVTANRKNDRNPIVFVQNDGESEQTAMKRFQGKGKVENIVEGGSIVIGNLYRFDAENTLSFDPVLNYLKMDARNQEERFYVNGQQWQIQGSSSTKIMMLNLPLSWSREVGGNGQLNVDMNVSRNQVLTSTSNTNSLSALHSETSRSLSDDNTDMDTYRLKVNYTQNMEGGHEFKTGLSWSKKEQNSSNLYSLNGRPNLSLAQFGETTRIDNTTLRLFIEDEWRVNKTTAINTGLSSEDNASDIQEGALASQSRFRVWSPSFHFSKKIPDDTKRQFRLSLARSFKAPDPNNLMLRPVINVLAPCSSVLTCGQNSLDTADSAGNPGLQAEGAISLNASYEHGLSENSQISFETYARQIEQKFGREISLETVAWSHLPRYVNRPVNLGDARIIGTSVDWQVALRDIWKTGPRIEIRGSVGRAHSTVSNLPAPYNHLEGQTPWRAKLGMTFDLEGIPLKVNMDANWLPGDWIRNNLVQKTYESRHASYAANAIWVASKTMKWSMSLNNLFAPNKQSMNEYQSGQNFVQRKSEKSNYTQLGLRLEIKL